MPRGVGAPTAEQLIERFYDAFTAQELDELVALLHPEVELQTARGLRRGREEARTWATKAPTGHLDQRIVLEQVRSGPGAAHAVALIRKQWWWREDADPDDEGRPGPAYDEPEAALFTFRDGLIARWQPFADRAEALGLLGELERR